MYMGGKGGVDVSGGLALGATGLGATVPVRLTVRRVVVPLPVRELQQQSHLLGGGDPPRLWQFAGDRTAQKLPQ